MLFHPSCQSTNCCFLGDGTLTPQFTGTGVGLKEHLSAICENRHVNPSHQAEGTGASVAEHPTSGASVAEHPTSGVSVAEHPTSGVSVAEHPTSGASVAEHPTSGASVAEHPTSGASVAVSVAEHPTSGVSVAVSEHPTSEIVPTAKPSDTLNMH
ncbi:sperm acrosomal protein FSA-ACR.1-like isoform X2 [Alosa sapidissima]|uniref:sperm acrosomal protein FSA-ACR.1-like isoform X2 n=1 Tax=Alosa sapidissima TaxID=34773 RepID=UPI001C08001F|nr:sperm acrosomal protein FSA-ACR.1-like isoform X2 [Alosa sapidissima]XP_041936836.1 sperm acrosomal protein FSA-ACR.1-like isoform X2 [Alosa sapidissima]